MEPNGNKQSHIFIKDWICKGLDNILKFGEALNVGGKAQIISREAKIPKSKGKYAYDFLKSYEEKLKSQGQSEQPDG